MNDHGKDTDELMDDVDVITDVLPSPADLVFGDGPLPQSTDGSGYESGRIFGLLDIPVTYRLREYLQVLVDFYPIAIRRRANKSKPSTGPVKRPGLSAKALLYSVGAMAFLLKREKVGACRFKIDEHGIQRAAKDGTQFVAWADVVCVWVLSSAYLIEKGQSAMPIPFRSMSDEQRTAFETYAAHRLTIAPTSVVASDITRHA